MKILLEEKSFDPFDYLKDYQSQYLSHAKYGACSSFIGTMRDFNQQTKVSHLFLEHYSPMTENTLEAIMLFAIKEWHLEDCLIIHRVGDIYPNDTIVLIATWSAHRAASLQATQYLIEALKSKVPFWKKESLASGVSKWVENNTPSHI